MIWIVICAGLASVTFLANKGMNNQKKSAELKLKMEEIEERRKENKKAQEEKDELKKKYDENENKINDLERKLDDAKKKLIDPNLSDEERSTWKSKARQYEDEINTLRGNNTSILDTIKGIEKRIKDNNGIISKTLSNLGDKNWILDLFTLENIVIAGGCYMAYKLLKDDKR